MIFLIYDIGADIETHDLLRIPNPYNSLSFLKNKIAPRLRYLHRCPPLRLNFRPN